MNKKEQPEAKLLTLKQEIYLLRHATLKQHHPKQLLFFADPQHIHLNFTKPVSCKLKP